MTASPPSPTRPHAAARVPAGRSLLGASIVLVLAGCGGKDPATGKAEPTVGEVAREAVNAPGRYVAANFAARDSAERQTAVATVRQALQLYQVQEEKAPATLQDLVAKGYLPALPKLPTGWDWQYDPATVTVNAVPQP